MPTPGFLDSAVALGLWGQAGAPCSCPRVVLTHSVFCPAAWVQKGLPQHQEFHLPKGVLPSLPKHSFKHKLNGHQEVLKTENGQMRAGPWLSAPGAWQEDLVWGCTCWSGVRRDRKEGRL